MRIRITRSELKAKASKLSKLFSKQFFSLYRTPTLSHQRVYMRV